MQAVDGKLIILMQNVISRNRPTEKPENPHNTFKKELEVANDDRAG